MSFVHVNNVDLYYEIAGKGPTVMFLHGLTGSCGDWLNQIEVLTPTYNVIAIDMRGHGKSAVPKTQSEYSISIFAEDVFQTLQLLGINKCCLVGHSIGGFIALQFALSHSDRLTGLVLVDSFSGRFKRNPNAPFQLSKKIVSLVHSQDLPQAERGTSWQKALTTSAAGYMYSAKAASKRQDLTSRLCEIRVPTVVYWGSEDTQFAEAVKILETGIAGSKLITIEGAGHNPHQEKPETFNLSILEFLKTVKW